jgi:hypothetical protein
VLEKSFGPEHTSVAEALETIAQINYFSRRYPEARVAAARALAINEKAYGAGATVLREQLLFLGWCDLETGEPARALAELERAYTLREGADPCFLSNIEFALARAIVANRGERGRAITLARAARADMLDRCDMEKERKDVDRWLARNGG